MAIYIDENTLDSVILDTNNKAVIAENFTYLVKNLLDFVDPQWDYHSVKMRFLRGGKRRATRALKSTKLGYIYRTAASKSVISNKGTREFEAFGEKFLVEEWEVSHPHIEDNELGEVYPTEDKYKKKPNVPRGPYTCIITARVSIAKHHKTRCYVQCNCKDFDTTFYERLNSEHYTNPKQLPKSTGKKKLAPAMCKHLYAIYSKYYSDLIKDTEKFVIDSNPVLFGSESSDIDLAPSTTPAVTTKQNNEVSSKEEAIKLIRDRLREEDRRLTSKDAYFDTRSKKSGYQSYHFYKFQVVLINGQISGIGYRNRTLADPKFTDNRPIRLIHIPNVPNEAKIWNFFNKVKDRYLLWELITTSTTKMPKKLQNEIKTHIWENMEIVAVADTEFLSESSILTSISELNNI